MDFSQWLYIGLISKRFNKNSDLKAKNTDDVIDNTLLSKNNLYLTKVKS